MLCARRICSGPGLDVVDIRCSASRGDAGAEEATVEHEVILPRRGVFVRHVGSRQVLADPNHALVFRRGEDYRVSHPSTGGDACTVLVLSDDLLREALTGRGGGGLPERVRTPAAVDLLHRGLVRAGREGGDLALQELALVLLDRLACWWLHGEERPAGSRTHTAHADLVDHACTFLGSALDAKLDLFDLARRVGASPFHLCRLFRRHTGTTIHAYHERLRLRAALERILDGQDDLTALALELGFSHHSHFTNRFRREYGLAPSACRKIRAARDVLALSSRSS